jgi:hypothetical protein
MYDRLTKVLVTQTGNDTATSAAFSLPALDGKSAYQIERVDCYWADAHTAPAADWLLNVGIQVEDAALTLLDDELIVQAGWAMQNTAGVAVAVAVNPYLTFESGMPRLTVQPYVYARVSSSATAQANDVYFTMYYSIVKLSELEYLRLLAGGA